MSKKLNNTVNNEIPCRFGFYGRMKVEFPSQVIIDVTEVCNLACIHCPQPLFRQSKYYTGSFLSPELSTKAVDEVKKYGADTVQYIRFTGEGEPLLHKNIYEMLKYAVVNSSKIVTLTTNGTIMTESRIEKLVDTGINVIDISIDAYKAETYAKIRVNGSLDVTRANVLNLIRASRNNHNSLKVVVSYIEQPQNRHETQDFEKFWKDNGADYVVIRRLHSAAGSIRHTAEKMWTENQKEYRRPCTYPWERIVLSSIGHLCYCPAGWSNSASVDNYRLITIRDAWQGEFYNSLRNAHLSNDFKDHIFCGQCPDWKATRWPDEGRSYANMIEDFKASE